MKYVWTNTKYPGRIKAFDPRTPLRQCGDLAGPWGFRKTRRSGGKGGVGASGHSHRPEGQNVQSKGWKRGWWGVICGANHPGRWSAPSRESEHIMREGGVEKRQRILECQLLPCLSPESERKKERATGAVLLHQPRLQGTTRVFGVQLKGCFAPRIEILPVY